MALGRVAWKQAVYRGDLSIDIVNLITPLCKTKKHTFQMGAVETRENQRALNAEQEDLDEIIETLKGPYRRDGYTRE
ncbi:MAG: hypothetical protein CM1200mP22_26360 [Dehalococcoidia bacterium]|nr:MAG: hypothetical protein CM1200mP22_26360 [Dehalococcoidia bacterium]